VAPADNSTSAKLSETDSQTVQSVSEPPEPNVFGAFTVADLQDMQVEPSDVAQHMDRFCNG
jgi:hypothetical protein